MNYLFEFFGPRIIAFRLFKNLNSNIMFRTRRLRQAVLPFFGQCRGQLVIMVPPPRFYPKHQQQFNQAKIAFFSGRVQKCIATVLILKVYIGIIKVFFNAIDIQTGFGDKLNKVDESLIDWLLYNA